MDLLEAWATAQKEADRMDLPMEIWLGESGEYWVAPYYSEHHQGFVAKINPLPKENPNDRND